MVEIIENGDDFLVLKSPRTGLVFGVMLDSGRNGETITAAPLREMLRPVSVKPLSAKMPSDTRKPASKARAARRAAARPQDARNPGERMEQVRRIVAEHGPLKASAINQLLRDLGGAPQSDTAIYTQLRKLEKDGLVDREERQEENANGREAIVRYYHAVEPAESSAGEQPPAEPESEAVPVAGGGVLVND